MKPSIPSFAVRRWQFTLLMLILLICLGAIAALGMPRSEDPIFPLPDVVVRVVLPGANSAQLEATVVRPLERAIAGLESVDELRSTSAQDAALVSVHFDWGVDPERKYDEVVREVNAVRASLPEGITSIDIRRTRMTNVAIVQFALVSDVMPMRRLEKLAHRLTDQLQQTPGVREAQYWGVAPSEVSVALDIPKLHELQLPPTAVVEALRAAGSQSPIGALEAGGRRFTVHADGGFQDLDTIGDTPLRAARGQVVRIRDVAQIAWAQPDPTHLTRFNGRRAVFVTVLQKDRSDAIAVTARVRRAMAAYASTLPPGVSLQPAFFQADNISHRLDHLYRDLLIAIGIVAVTLIPLGWRAGLVVMASIPTSLVAALLLLDGLGFTLNQLSIAGFVLALGLLVDDSIVVVENIARHLREGANRLDASIRGAEQIAWPVVGCTAALVLAFVPLVSLSGNSGAYIRSLPAAVLCAVAASLVVALTITPFLASRFLTAGGPSHGNFALRVLNAAIHAAYAPLLDVALRRPWLTMVLLSAICVTTAPLAHRTGFSLFPSAERPQFLVRAQLPQGASMAATDEVLRQIENRLARDRDLTWRLANLGRGNPQIYYNQPQRLTDPTYAEVFVGLREWRVGRSEAVLEGLRQRLSDIAGARIEVVEFVNGAQAGAPVRVQILGPDISELHRLADAAERILDQTKGARDVVNPLRAPNLDIDLGVNTDKASALGVPAGAIREIAHIAFGGEDVARFHDLDGDDYPVRVRVPMATLGGASRNLVQTLDWLYVPTVDGRSAPLTAIAAPALVSSPSAIERIDQTRAVTVTAEVTPGSNAGSVARAAFAQMRRSIVLPPGYRWSLDGDAKAEAEGFSSLLAAVAVAILGILAVLLLEFRRFRTALAVAGIIPFGILGAVAALWITGYSISFFAGVGVVALIGIEIKNSILLVDFTERLREEGYSLEIALKRAAELRFLPVLLTSVTAIGGLAPLAWERSGLYSPLAVAIIGGLVSSTILARIATPVTYYLIFRGRAEPRLATALEMPAEEGAAA